MALEERAIRRVLAEYLVARERGGWSRRTCWTADKVLRRLLAIPWERLEPVPTLAEVEEFLGAGYSDLYRARLHRLLRDFFGFVQQRGVDLRGGDPGESDAAA